MNTPLTPLIEYFRSARAELEKVTWPTRQETLRYSLLVVGVSVVMAGFFAALDFGLSQSIDLALKRQGTTNAPSAPINQGVNPFLEKNVQGFDEAGNPVDIKVTPITP